jgi:hypothetical protein
MAEKDMRETEGTDLVGSELKEHVTHWAQVLDRWVQKIDKRLGRQDGGLPAPTPDEADMGPDAEQ